MKKIPFNYKIALENPKAVVKVKGGRLVTGLTLNQATNPYPLRGFVSNIKGYTTWTIDGYWREDHLPDDYDLQLYVPFTSLWDRIKYYLKKS